MSNSSTHDSSAKSVVEEKKDDVIAPKGLELSAPTIGIKSSGRGGAGNIGSRRLLQLFGELKQPSMEDLEAREREVLAAHRAKKLAKSSVLKTTGRGGLGNLRGTPKSRNSLPPSTQPRRSTSSSVASGRRSSSSSIRSVKRRSAKGKGKERELPIIKLGDPITGIPGLPPLFVQNEDSPPASPIRPTASTSRQIPPRRPAPTSPLPPIPAIDSPPSPLSLLPAIPNRPLNRLAQSQSRPSQASSRTSAAQALNSFPSIRGSITSKLYTQKQSAGGGAEWRLVTQVREEPRGARLFIIEEAVWELYSRDEIRREKQEAYEMKMMQKRVAKGRRGGWGVHSDIGGGYVSDPA